MREPTCSSLFELINKHAWEETKACVQSNPAEASVFITLGFDDGKNLPLHEACKHTPPPDVIEALLMAYPDAIKTRGQWGYVPLHFACASGAPFQLIYLLIKTYPGGTRRREDSGKIPLHLACKWGASEDTVRLIVQTYPEGIYVRDQDGKSAVDYLKSNLYPDKEVVKAILDRAPEYCIVSKAAYARVADEFASKTKETDEQHLAHVAELNAAFHKKLSEYQKREDDLKSELENEKRKVQSLGRQMRECHEKINNMIESNSGHVSKIQAKHEEEKATFHETERGLRADAETKTNEVQSLNNKLQELMTQFDCLRSDLVRERSDNAAAAKQIRKLQAQLTIRENSMKKLTNLIGNLEGLLVDAEDQLEAVKNS